ncbi:hypothetical protein LSUE1_G004189 [Lachnellula suecica]|uniref:BTB domain-containing protein n=1 Tax=Lachnellula suecica TaxID=602035 RepID=A0A8T9C2F3_9HELO|nr:hypothetical protein LSUE1_G004189 [Lachnellula suecica]
MFSVPESSRKRAKRESQPIVLQGYGLKPDTQLEVFGQEFHVVSSALKMHSAFFAKFLDSADKMPAVAPNSKFKYNWVTKVDADGTGWGLVHWESLENSKAPDIITKFSGKTTHEVAAFESLMHAIHGWAIAISDQAHLHLVTQLADYYRALPILSLTVSAALPTNPGMTAAIPQHCCSILEDAYKLRNATLFRECLVYACGPWDSPAGPQYMTLQNTKLKFVVERAYHRFNTSLLQFQTLLLKKTAETLIGPSVGLELMMEVGKSVEGGKDFHLPAYFRQATKVSDLASCQVVKESADRLLKSCLTLDQGAARSGYGDFRNFFLGFEISDDDLPWDVNERHW